MLSQVRFRSFLCLAALPVVAMAAPEEDPRPLLGDEHPRAFFFRQAEGLAARQQMSYEQWSQGFGRLMGVMGKVLDEEVPGRSRGLPIFVRFKREHPEQAVLLHINGNARDPRYEGNRFFAGHWLYFNGATVLDDVRAEAGETTLRVSDPVLFETGGGRYRNSNDDIGLCELDAKGRPDWARAEQAQLLAVDRRAKTIRVRRGAFGTAPRAFSAGRAYAAAHLSEGPWGAESHLLWAYNYATTCPRDGQGRTAADIYVQHLAELFNAGGPLATFDGLEFDVLFNEPNGARRPAGRGADCDADGKRDNGVMGGVNVYGNGVVGFCRQLRAALGGQKLILADGAFRRDNQQRATGILNGIESEGWPVLGDFKIEDWSGGLNRHEFWRTHAHTPAFSYANVKFVEAGGTPGRTQQAQVPFGSVRLAFAGALFTDSAITFAHRPGTERGAGGIWDELVAGQEARVGWLGRALGPARHLADETPSVLGGVALAAMKLRSDDARIIPERGGIKLEASRGDAKELTLIVVDVPTTGADLCVRVRAHGSPMASAASDVARMMRAAIYPSARSKAAGPEIMSWVARDEFGSRFYFRTTPGGGGELRLRFESREPVWISSIRCHAAPDLVAREFAHGAVLANPSDQPREFDVEKLFPGRRWRRLRGTAGQDPATNNGEAVGAKVILPARDALFLAERVGP